MEEKDKVFKFSKKKVKYSQEKLKNKEVFKLDDKNYKDYEAFIIDSLGITKTSKLNEIEV